MIIAIETSGSICSVAFHADGKTIKEYSSAEPMQHSKRIGAFIEAGLRETAIEPQALAVAIGPGSFTGLRIGLSYAQGFCFGKGIEVIGVSNHQALAHQADDFTNTLFSAIDARRDEVYLARHNHNNKYEISDHKIVTLKTLKTHLKESDTIVFYEDFNLDKALLEELNTLKVKIKRARFGAKFIAQVGSILLQERGADSLEELEPLYIRPFAGV